jgi:hypothetical protein
MKIKFLLKVFLIIIILNLFLSNFPPSTCLAQEKIIAGHQNIYQITDFLPKDHKKDGSVSYQKGIQEALDLIAGSPSTIIFPPMVYLIDEKGITLHSDMTLQMHGAIFQIKSDCVSDGQAFYGKNLQNVRISGGEITGAIGKWATGVNIRGIYFTGKSEKIRISNMYIHDLTSNAIGVFAEAENMARDIWVTDVIAQDGCNYYGDYLSERPGPEKDSHRHDQGLIAFYYVQDFTVRGCRFERSRSDGTHFYKCKEGQIVENKIYSAQMGGYFLEGCESVSGSNNIIRDNGSRGCTIERGSINCILQGNVVANSGREGLWAPNCTGLIVSDNIFDRNGRKPNGNEARQRWNANITINSAHDPTNTFTADYHIADNIFYTTVSQIAAIRIETAVSKNIVVINNQFRGENDLVLVEGENINTIQVMDNY